MVSTQTKITRLLGLLDTPDLSDWEAGFVRNMVEKQNNAKVSKTPLELTDAQLEKLDDIFNKHFGG